MQITSEFLLKKLMKANIVLAINKFVSHIFFSFTYGTSGQVCGGIGWGSEAVNLKLTVNYQLVDCYKKWINDMNNWDSTFNGADAKWIDECTLSTSAGDIELIDSALSEAITGNNIIGGTAINSWGCFKWAEWSTSAPFFAGFF